MLLNYVNKIKDVLYRFIYASLMSIGIILLFFSYIGVSEVTFSHVIFVILLIVLISIFIKVSISLKIITVVGGATLVFMYFKGMEGTVSEIVINNQFYLWATLIVALSYGLVYVWQKITIIKMIMLVALTIYSAVLLVNQIILYRGAIACLYTLILLLLIELIQKLKKGESDEALVVSILPFYILFFIGIMFSKESKNPYKWEFVKDAYNRIKANVTELSEKIFDNDVEDYFYSMYGYGDSSKIGDHVSNGDNELMIISSDRKMPCNMYLLGEYKTTFDGKEWEDSDENTFGKNQTEQATYEKEIDALETLYAIESYDNDILKNMIVTNRLVTEYKQFHTKNNFTSSKSFITQKDVPDKKSYGDKINSTCFQIYAGKDLICDLIQNRKEGGEKTWNSVCIKYGINDISYEDYVNHRSAIADSYTEDVTLSDDLKAWVKEVTKDTKSKEERLFAIQDALRRFEYTTEVDSNLSNIKSPEEFLDYFILDKKEGYCTYFATAFVLLARSEGYPARYAKGFYVPISGRFTSRVTGKMAHAWAEVYFEGVGWVPFENTPSYEGVAYTNVDYSMAKDWSIAGNEINLQEKEETDTTEAIEEDSVVEKGNKKVRIALFIVALMVIGIMVDIILARAKYKKMSLDEKYFLQVKRNLYLLGKMGLSCQKGETLSELENRIIKRYEELGNPPPDFISDYENVIYGQYEVTENLLSQVCEERQKMIKYISVFERVKLRVQV